MRTVELKITPPATALAGLVCSLASIVVFRRARTRPASR